MLYKSDIQEPQPQQSDIFTLLLFDLFSVYLQHILAAWTAAGGQVCFGYILDEVTHLSKPCISVHCNLGLGIVQNLTTRF